MSFSYRDISHRCTMWLTVLLLSFCFSYLFLRALWVVQGFDDTFPCLVLSMMHLKSVHINDDKWYELCLASNKVKAYVFEHQDVEFPVQLVLIYPNIRASNNFTQVTNIMRSFPLPSLRIPHSWRLHWVTAHSFFFFSHPHVLVKLCEHRETMCALYYLHKYSAFPFR